MGSQVNATVSATDAKVCWQGSASLHPDAYALLVVDDGLGPRVEKGKFVVVEPIYPAPGDIAVVELSGARQSLLREVVQFDPEWMSREGRPQMIPLVGFRQLNPLRVEFVPVTGIVRLDRASVLPS